MTQDDLAKVDQELSALIDSMKEEDQKYRHQITELTNLPNPDEQALQAAIDSARTVDHQNMIQAKKIFQEYGYPGVDLVGERSAFNFWLIIQHCDEDPAFQEEVLRTMEIELKKGNVETRNYVYLLDRVLVNQGKLQIYGTQVLVNEDSTSYEPKPMMDPAQVDERRKGVGLEPIESYIQTMNTLYFGDLKQKKNKQT